VPTLRVDPRQTPAERSDTPVEVEISDDLAVFANQLEEWAAPLEHWQLSFRQGHDFDRPDNVEARLLFPAGEQTSSIVFRLDQLESIQEFERELWLTLDEDNGISNAVHLTPFGVDVELHHIVGPPLGGTPA
jgi:hypothetical protein